MGTFPCTLQMKTCNFECVSFTGLRFSPWCILADVCFDIPSHRPQVGFQRVMQV